MASAFAHVGVYSIYTKCKLSEDRLVLLAPFLDNNPPEIAVSSDA